MRKQASLGRRPFEVPGARRRPMALVRASGREIRHALALSDYLSPTASAKNARQH
jgi:hypothetical protein